MFHISLYVVNMDRSVSGILETEGRCCHVGQAENCSNFRRHLMHTAQRGHTIYTSSDHKTTFLSGSNILPHTEFVKRCGSKLIFYSIEEFTELYFY